MADLEEALGRRAGMMTHQEVIQQYFKVFGREMTQTERDAFFLPHRKNSPHEEMIVGQATRETEEELSDRVAR
jgi:hypothetical protein